MLMLQVPLKPLLKPVDSEPARVSFAIQTQHVALKTLYQRGRFHNAEEDVLLTSSSLSDTHLDIYIFMLSYNTAL